MVNYGDILSICTALGAACLVYFIPIWWVLWRAGLRKYLKLQNHLAGSTFEVVSGFVLAGGLVLAIPDFAVWIIMNILELTFDGEFAAIATTHRRLFHYLYPVGLTAFLGYLWINRNRAQV